MKPKQKLQQMQRRVWEGKTVSMQDLVTLEYIPGKTAENQLVKAKRLRPTKKDRFKSIRLKKLIRNLMNRIVRSPKFHFLSILENTQKEAYEAWEKKWKTVACWAMAKKGKIYKYL